ncbi:hypothetical protein [Streptomyces goshikiensis]|uniref:hypothetical protein n=1 Tax=Streptomyces goshikiensis TaxID=1942 RepID=UPI003720137E
MIDGAWQSHATPFSVAELMDDTERPAPAEAVDDRPAAPDPKPEPEPVIPTLPTVAVERDGDGVPVKPAWLGRTDLA